MMIATMKSLLYITALSATICTAAYAADTSALDALEAKMEAKMEAKYGAKIDALQAEVFKNRADKVDASPSLLRRRELWSSWQEVHDKLQDKVEKVTQGLRSLYIEENLDEGDAVTVYEAGPIKVQVGCGGSTVATSGICRPSSATSSLPSSEVCLVLTVSNTGVDDIRAFGQSIQGFDEFISQGETFEIEPWKVSSRGNDYEKGAVWVDGHYLGYNGESFIGLQSNSELEVIGGNCQVAGVLDYFIPFHKDD